MSADVGSLVLLFSSMSPVTTTPAEDLILMLTQTDLLSEDQKTLFIGELLEGRVHPELEGMIDAVVAREIDLATQEESAIKRAMQLNDEVLARAEEEADAEASQLLAHGEQSMNAIVSDFTIACDGIEREYQRDEEKIFRTQDTSQADAIRQMLQQKP